MQLDRETDIDILRQKAMLLQRENELLHARLAQLADALDKARGGEQQTLALEIESLKERLAQQNRALFGKSSEKQKHAAAKPERAPQPGHGPTPQPKLPVVEKIHELDEADKVCTA